jgi:hypothetical protein
MAVLFRIETMWIQHTAWAPVNASSTCEAVFEQSLSADPAIFRQ